MASWKTEHALLAKAACTNYVMPRSTRLYDIPWQVAMPRLYDMPLQVSMPRGALSIRASGEVVLHLQKAREALPIEALRAFDLPHGARHLKRHVQGS
jgi:hypothetical protein